PRSHTLLPNRPRRLGADPRGPLDPQSPTGATFGSDSRGPAVTTSVAPPVALRPRPQVCRACGALHEPAPVAICEQCLGPLDPVLDPARVLPTRDAIAARPWSLWRYREWLPFDGEPVLSLDTGGTPLV